MGFKADLKFKNFDVRDKNGWLLNYSAKSLCDNYDYAVVRSFESPFKKLKGIIIKPDLNRKQKYGGTIDEPLLWQIFNQRYNRNLKGRKWNFENQVHKILLKRNVIEIAPWGNLTQVATVRS